MNFIEATMLLWLDNLLFVEQIVFLDLSHDCSISFIKIFLYDDVSINSFRYLIQTNIYTYSFSLLAYQLLLSRKGNSTFLSNLPVLRSAGSRVPALFAMIHLMFVVWSKPSIWFKSSIKILWTSFHYSQFYRNFQSTINTRKVTNYIFLSSKDLDSILETHKKKNQVR